MADVKRCLRSGPPAAKGHAVHVGLGVAWKGPGAILDSLLGSLNPL